jgi:hypothetical protein
MGDCFNARDIRKPTKPLPNHIDIMSCTRSHDAEVYFSDSIWLSTQPYPGDKEIDDRYHARCKDQLEGYVGMRYEQSMLEYVSWVPNTNTWKVGDRRSICAAYSPYRALSYSVKGLRV